MLVTRALCCLARLGALALCCISAHAEGSPAGPTSRTLSVEYTGPEGCPGREAFVAAILKGSPQAVLSTADAAAIQFRVEVGSGGRSTLWIALENGSSRRDIEGASCEDAVATMALIAAMVVEADPEQRIAAADAAVPRSESGPSAPESRASTEHRPEPAVATRPARRQLAEGSARPRSAPWRGIVTLGLTTESALATIPPLGAAAGVEVSRIGTRGWGAVARAEVIATLIGTSQSPNGSARTRLLAGRLSGCASHRVSRPWQLQPCVTFDAGVLDAEGDQVSAAESARMPWLALGAQLRAQYNLDHTWGLEGALGVKRLARHDRFYVRPGSTIYEVPTLSVGATFGLNFSFF